MLQGPFLIGSFQAAAPFRGLRRFTSRGVPAGLCAPSTPWPVYWHQLSLWFESEHCCQLRLREKSKCSCVTLQVSPSQTTSGNVNLDLPGYTQQGLFLQLEWLGM